MIDASTDGLVCPVSGRCFTRMVSDWEVTHHLAHCPPPAFFSPSICLIYLCMTHCCC